VAKHIEWRCAIDFSGAVYLQEVRCADIVVTGGQNGALSDPFAAASPKDLVMQAGRPLFIVPDNVDWLDLRACWWLEGYAGSKTGDRRFPADAPQGQERHGRGDR